jgi:hypothetical protein
MGRKRALYPPVVWTRVAQSGGAEPTSINWHRTDSQACLIELARHCVLLAQDGSQLAHE